MMEWQPIETDPDDGALHLRGLWVTHNRTGARWWEVIAGRVDDTGDFVDHDGNSPWRKEDYSHWAPIPEPPK